MTDDPLPRLAKHVREIGTMPRADQQWLVTEFEALKRRFEVTEAARYEALKGSLALKADRDRLAARVKKLETTLHTIIDYAALEPAEIAAGVALSSGHVVYLASAALAGEEGE